MTEVLNADIEEEEEGVPKAKKNEILLDDALYVGGCPPEVGYPKPADIDWLNIRDIVSGKD